LCGFWSLTVYNEEHLIEPNPLNRFSVGTKSKSMKQNSNGSLMLYFQNKSPGSDKESNWVSTPTDGFSLYHSHLSAERTDSQPLAATAFGKQDWLDKAEPPRSAKMFGSMAKQVASRVDPLPCGGRSRQLS